MWKTGMPASAPAAIRPRAAWRRSKWAVRCGAACCVIWVGFRRTGLARLQGDGAGHFSASVRLRDSTLAIPAEAMLPRLAGHGSKTRSALR